MPRTRIDERQVEDAGIIRDDLNTTTTGDAVIRKVIAGTNVTITETGVDAGTGDVTINATDTSSDDLHWRRPLMVMGG